MGNSQLDLLKELEQYDTPTITNAVATYPSDKENCLGLYNPWEANWYANQSLKCMYPEIGRRAGYAVTVVYGMPDPAFGRLEFIDILKAIEKSPKPVILAVKQNFPEHIKNKNGLLGGNMLTSFKQVGVTGIVTDGPSRDLEEIRPLHIQCMFTGLAAGHGSFVIQAINVPVDICGMDVAPGEIIHAGEDGAVKFPAGYLEDVAVRVKRIQEGDEKRQAAIRATNDPVKIAKFMKGIYED
ncbi:RraA family protein [Treponema primitia]|uniref:RraA family protein n=1 Tax=Treponema primitia TaxID=88058 RepID=UPI00397F89F8